LILVALGFLEAGVRYTSVVDRWVDNPAALAGQASRDALASFDALETGRTLPIPRSGFPVVAPAKSDKTRLVVFGGSEVAAGPWSDDFSAYFPAALQALTGPEVEVLNQGVGDWTTFHIRLFAQEQLTALSPDIVVVYAGRYDLTENLPVTFAELHRHWQVHGAGGEPTALQELRLLQGARALLTTLLDLRLRPAVPVSDAAENLASLATAARALGGNVLLVKQGLAPNADRLTEYHAMLDDLAAAQDGVEVLDAATLLSEAGPGQFVDDRHLTAPGGALVASAIQTRLTELGWLSSQPTETSPE
jgi:lysophospholipase L1-like esterase